MPEDILIEEYPNSWIPYYKQYDLEDGAYYRNDDPDDVVFGMFIHIYSDGYMAYLWGGRENVWDVAWKENNYV